MISQDELRVLLSDLETDRVECTEATNKTDKFSEAVTAFANDFPCHQLPGYLIIGVDNNRKFSGLQVSDDLLTSLGGLRSDGNIQPLPAINVAKFVFPEGEVAVVEVLPSKLPPVRYKGRVWIRVGPRRASASEQEERILTERRVSHAATFDAQPCLDSTLQDLAVNRFENDYLSYAVDEEVIRENHRDIKQQLASLRFFDLKNDCPTNAGILLFGKNPLAWIPGAYVQFLLLDGVTLHDTVIQERALSGDLASLLRELEALIKLQIELHPERESVLRERLVSTYPEIALRELVSNAVLHRSYDSTAPIRFYWFSDRIEIQSPGGLYGEASRANFPNQNTYRNPVIAEAMKNLGFVNRFGRGVFRAQDALTKNGNPKATFDFDHHFVRVTISGKP